MNLETEISRDLWQAVRRSYESQAWSNSVLDSIRFLSDALRTKSGLESDGAALAGQALGGKAPRLRLNRLQTESEWNVQSGTEQIFRGVYQAIRNPRSHERFEDSQSDADAIIHFVDFLLRLIGHAKGAFIVSDFVARIMEANFVPDARYATVLVGEIPTRKRLEVALSAFAGKIEADGEKLRFFFDAIIPMLTEADSGAFFEAVSNELKTSDDISALCRVLQMLDPSHWLRIDEAARLRSENRLIEDIRDGRYIVGHDKCLAGSVGTWVRDFLAHFALKDQLYQVLGEKLLSNSVLSQDYVLKFHFAKIDVLKEAPTAGLEQLLIQKLRAGDVRFQRALDSSYLWNNKKWSEALVKCRVEFKESKQVVVEDSDDIPF